MRLCFATLLSAGLLSFGFAAHADTMAPYNLGGSLEDGGTYSGNIVVDTAQYTTSITTVDIVSDGITFDASTAQASTYNSLNSQPIFQNNGAPNGSNPNYPYAEVEIDTTYEHLYLLIKDNSGFFSVCSYTATCNGGGYTLMTNSLNYINYATSGTISAATPELSSLMLLGTGILGATGLVRRRMVVRKSGVVAA